MEMNSRSTSVVGRLLLSLATLASVFCLVSMAGAFTQAVAIAMPLFLIFGAAAMFGHLKWAVVNLFLLAVASSISPFSDLSRIYGTGLIIPSLLLCAAALGFLGLLIGIGKLQRESGPSAQA